MRLSIGYQLPDEDDSLVEIVRDYRESIAEVYFALPGHASGRSPLGGAGGEGDPEARAILMEELAAISEMGVELVLLLNAACYGEEAISRAFAESIRKTLRDFLAELPLAAVTTTSPFVARVIKEAFPELETRASVNMRVGTVKGMQYLADHFDGFCMQREYNRDPDQIEELKAWCDAHGKRLYFLANSGCMRSCSWQSFHDNLVAHEAGASTRDNVPLGYPSPCWEFMARRENWVAYLQNTWVRPEDLRHYERWFSLSKLATRMHSNPRRVVAAYARGRFHGNLLDLTEPSYAPLLRGYILDNQRFPDDWFERTASCDKACHRCAYCESVLQQVLVSVEELLRGVQGGSRC